MGRKKRKGEEADPATPPRPAATPPAWPKLSSRHGETLKAIFARPTRSDIPWRDIEGLFEALGGSVSSGSGSRRRVRLGQRRAVFHEPHPERVTDKGAVQSVRDFLTNAGMRP